MLIGLKCHILLTNIYLLDSDINLLISKYRISALKWYITWLSYYMGKGWKKGINMVGVIWVNCTLKGNWSIFRGGNSAKSFLPPYWKGIYFKLKKMLPRGYKILYFKSRPLSERNSKGSKTNRKSQKLSPLQNNGVLPSVFSPLNFWCHDKTVKTVTRYHILRNVNPGPAEPGPAETYTLP